MNLSKLKEGIEFCGKLEVGYDLKDKTLLFLIVKNQFAIMQALVDLARDREDRKKEVEDRFDEIDFSLRKLKGEKEERR